MTRAVKGLPVSTHSRLKAAGDGVKASVLTINVSTHSRLKAAGYAAPQDCDLMDEVSTHSRLKAAGTLESIMTTGYKFQHTAA